MFEAAIGQSAAILDSYSIALVVVRDRQFVWANRAMHRILRYPPDELIGKFTRMLFLDQESYEAFGRDVFSTIGNGGAFSREIQQKRHDGSTGWFEYNISHLKGHPDVLVGAVLDVTEKHDLAERLEQSNARYRSVLLDQTEVISRLKPDGTFIFVNEVFCALFGKTPEELIGQQWQPVAHPDDLRMAEDRLRQMTADNPVVTIESRVFVAGGGQRWMQFVNRGFFDPGGQLREFQSVGRDITDQKRIGNALRDSEERLEMALSATGLGIWDVHVPTGTVIADRRTSEILGHTIEDLSRRDFWKSLHDPKEYAQFERDVDAHLQGDTASVHSEHRLRHKDGHWVTVETQGKVSQRDKDGAPLRMVGTLRDVTRRRRLNEVGVDLLRQIETLIRESTTASPTRPTENEALESLTKRERQILGMIADGMTSVQIAQQLELATNTVISHRQKLMGKLGLHSTAEVIRFAIDHEVHKPS